MDLIFFWKNSAAFQTDPIAFLFRIQALTLSTSAFIFWQDSESDNRKRWNRKTFEIYHAKTLKSAGN
jgi:hypothetical protein